MAKTKKPPRQNSTRLRCTTTTISYTQQQKLNTHRKGELTKRHEAEKRERKTNRRLEGEAKEVGDKRSGVAAGGLPWKVECDFPYEGQQLEHLQGRCAHDAERRTHRDVDTTPRGRARNPRRQRSGRRAGGPRCRGDARILNEGGQMST